MSALANPPGRAPALPGHLDHLTPRERRPDRPLVLANAPVDALLAHPVTAGQQAEEQHIAACRAAVRGDRVEAARQHRAAARSEHAVAEHHRRAAAAERESIEDAIRASAIREQQCLDRARAAIERAAAAERLADQAERRG